MKILKLLFLILLVTISYSGICQTVLTTEAFQKKLSTTPTGQLLDVRTMGEYNQGHLLKSKNMDYNDPGFAQKIETLDKNKPVFVYCQAGGRSGKAAKLLVEKGFKEVYDLQGGFSKWSAANMPSAKPE